MRKLIIALCLCGVSALLSLPVSADPKVVPARLAALKFPTPTFDDLHERFVAIVVNESGFKSIADQDGMLQALLHGGGGRKSGRRYRGQGYGLDYTKLMRQMARHSKRTFPVNSKFLMLTAPQRAWLGKRQTRLNKWTSTLKLDCSEPTGWPKEKPDGTPMLPWRYFTERCQLLIETTRAILKGRVHSFCDGRPTTWGSIWDIERPGGALDRGWTEVHCDRPPDNPETCGQKTKLELWNGTTCARNTFWTWATVDKEAEYVRQERAAEPGS